MSWSFLTLLLLIGFGVEQVDTVRIENCPLPQLPLSVILHRTSIQPSPAIDPTSGIPYSSTKEVVSEVRSLRIHYSDATKVEVEHLKTVFNNLESVEKLSLVNVVIDASQESRTNGLMSDRAFLSRQKRQVVSTESTTYQDMTTKTDPESETATNSNKRIPSRTTYSDLRAPPNSPNDHNKLTTESISFSTSFVRLNSSPSATEVTTGPSVTLDPKVSSAEDKIPDLSGSSSDPEPQESAKSLFLYQYFPKLKWLLLEGVFPPSLTSENWHKLHLMLKNLDQIQSLTLRNNDLKKLRNHLFNSASSTLKRLYISGNGIRDIEPLALSDLKNLQILDLFNNDLTTLPTAVFKDLTSLEYLRLGRNSFRTLPEDLLLSMPNLRTLDLNLNRNLTHLPDNLLSSVVHLENLTLSDCQLEKLSNDPSKLLSSTGSLQKIEMRGNRLRNLTSRGLFGQSPQLVKLDISFNEIQIISSVVFSINSSNLEELNLYGNELKSLEAGTFQHLKNLRILNIGFNKLQTLSPELLFSFKKLEELDVSKNQLATVNPQRSVLPFGLGNLHKLNFAQNNLTDFSEFEVIDWSLYLKISDINLSNNQISGEVELPVFLSTPPQVILDLRMNQIQTIRMKKIMEYERAVLEFAADEKVRRSNWKGSGGSLSSSSQVIVFLERNPLKCDCRLEPLVSYVNSSASDLQAAFRGNFNRVSFDFHSDDLQCAEPAALANMTLHKVDPLNLTCPVTDQSICPPKCSCNFRASDSRITVDCRHKSLLTIPESLTTVSNYRNIAIGSSNESSWKLAAKVKRVSLLLSNNRIAKVDSLRRLLTLPRGGLSSSPSSSSKSHDSISFELFLDNNRIESLPEDFLQWPNLNHASSIAVLSLRKNRLSKLPAAFLDGIIQPNLISNNNLSASNGSFKLQVSQLFLGENPYDCSPQKVSQPADPIDCPFIYFKSWLSTNHPLVPDLTQIKCSVVANSSASEPRALVELSDIELCPQLAFSNEGGLLVLSVICVILSLALLVISILYYRNKHTVLAFIYIHVNPVFLCLNFSEEDLDEEKSYDAFLSYSSADRDIVMEMIEKLEKPSDVSTDSISFLRQQSGIPTVHEGRSDQIVPEINGDLRRSRKQGDPKDGTGSYYSLCIHERDWLPGNLISWNIVNSVQNSRRTILILSKEFIQSIWFQVEFHTAYYQMLEDKMDRLIVVVRGELPPRDQMDKDLVFLLTTKTYLVWGEKWFWEKLRYALPHRRSGGSGAKNKALTDTSEQKDASIFSSGSGFTLKVNGTKAASKSDLMKEYVDQTISDHFQLQASGKTMSPFSDPTINKNNRVNSRLKEGHINDSFVVETET